MKTQPATVKDTTKLGENAQKQIKEQAKTEPKAEPTPKAPKAKPPYLLFLTTLIEEGKYDQKTLQQMAWDKFPEVSKSTIQTVIIDSKNIKYNRFPHLVVKDDKGILSFKK
jgi:hypothetical protein